MIERGYRKIILLFPHVLFILNNSVQDYKQKIILNIMVDNM